MKCLWGCFATSYVTSSCSAAMAVCCGLCLHRDPGRGPESGSCRTTHGCIPAGPGRPRAVLVTTSCTAPRLGGRRCAPHGGGPHVGPAVRPCGRSDGRLCSIGHRSQTPAQTFFCGPPRVSSGVRSLLAALSYLQGGPINSGGTGLWVTRSCERGHQGASKRVLGHAGAWSPKASIVAAAWVGAAPVGAKWQGRSKASSQCHLHGWRRQRVAASAGMAASGAVLGHSATKLATTRDRDSIRFESASHGAASRVATRPYLFRLPLALLGPCKTRAPRGAVRPPFALQGPRGFFVLNFRCELEGSKWHNYVWQPHVGN